MKRNILLSLSLVLPAFAGVGAPQGVTNGMAEAMAPYVADGRLAGYISILYDKGREEVACGGTADLRTGRPIALDQVFQQCSQTKGFCGVTIAKLVEGGRLDLDDPVSKYLPEYKDLGFIIGKRDKDGNMPFSFATNAITVRMCMNHTAGLRFELKNHFQMGGWSHRMPLRSVAATAIGEPLRYQPGTETGYSNLGIDVGAAIVEVITGKSWEDYLKETVLDPLGMADTTFRPTDRQLANRIELSRTGKDGKVEYVASSESFVPPYNGPTVFPSAGGGLWTTARDQYKFYKMLLNRGVGDNGVRILKRETVENLIFRSTRPKKLHKSNAGYSLGFAAPLELKEDSWIGHGGAWSSECFFNPEKGFLKLWVIQSIDTDSPKDWPDARKAATERFFAGEASRSDSDYTGRLQ